MKRAEVQAPQAVDANDLTIGKDESILLEICGGMPSADTRCVGGMFPGKVRRRGHLYYRLKDYPSLQQVLGGFQSAIPLQDCSLE